MAEEKEKTKQESVTLPIWAIEIIKKMADKGIISTSKSDIYKQFILRSLNEIINEDYVEKAIKTKRLLDE